MVSKCIVVHFLVHFQVEVSPSHIVASQEVSSSPFSHFHVLFFALMLKVMVLRSSNKLRLKLKRVMALKNLGAPHFCLFSTVERIREQAFVIVELHPQLGCLRGLGNGQGYSQRDSWEVLAMSRMLSGKHAKEVLVMVEISPCLNCKGGFSDA